MRTKYFRKYVVRKENGIRLGFKRKAEKLLFVQYMSLINDAIEQKLLIPENLNDEEFKLIKKYFIDKKIKFERYDEIKKAWGWNLDWDDYWKLLDIMFKYSGFDHYEVEMELGEYCLADIIRQFRDNKEIVV